MMVQFFTIYDSVPGKLNEYYSIAQEKNIHAEKNYIRIQSYYYFDF